MSTDSDDKKEEQKTAESDGGNSASESTSTANKTSSTSGESASSVSESTSAVSETASTGTTAEAVNSSSSSEQALLGATKAPPTQQSFLLDLGLAQAVLLLVCMAGTSLWLWGDLGLTSSKNMSDSLRDFHELALLRKPLIAWCFPLMGIAGVACGPRETLNGRWLSMVSWIFISFIGVATLLCYLGQALPFIGVAAPKALNMVYANRLFLVPFLANAGLSAIIYLLRGMKLFVDADKKAALIGLGISVALIELTRLIFAGKA